MARDRLLAPVWNADERRVRALWRVLVTIVGLLVAMMLLQPLLGVLPFWWQMTAGNLLGMVALPLLVVWAAARVLDRRPLVGYGLRPDAGWWREFTVGALLGLAMYTVAAVVLVAAGWAEVTAVLSPGPHGLWLLLGAMTLYWLANGLWEELVFRGVFVKNAAEGFGGRWRPAVAVAAALVVSTVVFALVHIPDYLGAGMPLGGLFATWLFLGGLLGLAFALTGRLALPIGLHFTVNLALNNVFGLIVEEGDTATLLHLDVTGPAWVTGLGGAVHLAVIALGYGLLLLWARRRFGRVALAEGLATPPPHVRSGRVPADPRERVTAGEDRRQRS